MTLIWAFIRPFLPSPLTLALSAALLGIATWWSFHLYNRGWNAAVYAIALKDERAIYAADQISKRVNTCYDSGGSWDIPGGLCR